MNKINLVICVFAAVLLVTSFAAAMEIPANENAIENSAAPEHSPVVELTKDGRLLERMDFIHYANGVTKPARPAKDPVCYKLLKLKLQGTPVNYVINPVNTEGLSQKEITEAISASAETWDDETSSELFNQPTIDESVQYGVYDGKNALAFGDYGSSSVIAVTSYWYYRGIGKNLGAIVEFDMLFNDYYNWGDAERNPALMDLQNIATHEFGHSVGLDDIYTGSCISVTMYGYGDYGEIDKRTLEQPDITGLQKIYGI